MSQSTSLQTLPALSSSTLIVCVLSRTLFRLTELILSRPVGFFGLDWTLARVDSAQYAIWAAGGTGGQPTTTITTTSSPTPTTPVPTVSVSVFLVIALRQYYPRLIHMLNIF